MDNLEMLQCREQLMLDVECIVDSYESTAMTTTQLITYLCDAICTNFPVFDDEFQAANPSK